MADDVEAAVRGWLRDLERCVRDVDYDTARPLFADDVVGFGTFGTILQGIDALAADQWQNVWPNIDAFNFELDSLRGGADGALAWAICLWDSLGRRPDGETFKRPGRATIILRRDGNRWQAVHTHFSLTPRP
jgi:ketosteroid isomerase-like protein